MSAPRICNYQISCRRFHRSAMTAQAIVVRPRCEVSRRGMDGWIHSQVAMVDCRMRTDPVHCGTSVWATSARTARCLNLSAKHDGTQVCLLLTSLVMSLCIDDLLSSILLAFRSPASDIYKATKVKLLSSIPTPCRTRQPRSHSVSPTCLSVLSSKTPHAWRTAAPESTCRTS